MITIGEIVFYILIVIITFILMEGVAWFLHRCVMHGVGWFLHEEHHRYTKGRFEKNDIFGLFFSFVSFLLIVTGFFGGDYLMLSFGIGVAMYGIGYFLVHDTFFHHRIKIRYRPKSKYIKRVLNAHRIHHQKSTEHQGVCFGFLWASKTYEVKEKT